MSWEHDRFPVEMPSSNIEDAWKEKTTDNLKPIAVNSVCEGAFSLRKGNSQDSMACIFNLFFTDST